MARRSVRTVILCEDKSHADFVRKVCEAWGHRPVRVEIAPSGDGSGEQWVRLRYPGEVKKLRSHGDERVGLVATTDGDRFGVDGRKRSLAAALRESGATERHDQERIAIAVPTWSIETWFAWLCGLEDINEAKKYKNDSAYRAAVEQRLISPTKAARAWLQQPRDDEPEHVPSLADGRREMERLRVR